MAAKSGLLLASIALAAISAVEGGSTGGGGPPAEHECIGSTSDELMEKDVPLFGGSCPITDQTHDGEMLRTFRNRTGVEDSLIAHLATAWPYGAAQGIESLNSRPLSNAVLKNEGPQVLLMSLEVDRISAIDQKAQTFRMHYVIKWLWRDCRLLMHCKKVTVQSKHSRFGSFWAPPMRITQREADDPAMVTQKHELYGHGWDIFTEEHMSTFRCPFHFEDMPYDSHKCTLEFLLPDEPDSDYQILWKDDVVEGLELRNGGWVIDQVQDWKMWTGTVPYHSKSGDVNSSRAYVSFHITRKPAQMIESYVVSAGFFYVLSWVGLWISPAAVPARAAIGIIPVLVISNKITALYASLPPLGYATKISSYMTMALMMLTVNMLEYGVVHVSSKESKRLADALKAQKEKVVDECVVSVDAYEGGGASPPPFMLRTRLAIFSCLEKHLEMHARWVLPLIYIVASCVILG